MNKKTYNSLQEAEEEHYTIHPVEGKMWWHDEEMQKVPGAFINDDDETRALPLTIRNEMLLNVLNEAIWDNMHGWRQYHAEEVMDHPEDYIFPVEKKEPNFIEAIRRLVDLSTLTDEDILAMRELANGVLTSKEYEKWLQDSGTNVDVEMADAMLECPEDYVEEIDLMMDRSLVPDEGDNYELSNEEWNELNGNSPKGDTYYDADEEHHHLDGPLSEDEYETMMSSQEHSIPATPHADRALKMLKDTKELLERTKTRF